MPTSKGGCEQKSEAKNADLRVSELSFRVADFAKYKLGECVRSPTERIELFTYRLLVYPKGLQSQPGLAVFLESVPTEGLGPRVINANVSFEVTVVSQRLGVEDIVKKDTKSFSQGWDCGWRDILPTTSWKYDNFVDDDGDIVIRARIDLEASRLALGGPASGECSNDDEIEVTVDGVADFKKGEEIKFRPMRSGKYRLQVAVYPGGHPEHASGQESLAVYVHILDYEGDKIQANTHKLKITVINSKKARGPKKWEGTVLTTGMVDDSWGPHELLAVKKLLDNQLGWLDDDGAMLLKVSVKISKEGENPRAFRSPPKSIKRAIPHAGWPESLSKKTRPTL